MTQDTMHGWFCDALDGAQALHWRAAPMPVPGAHEALVRVHAASLNFPDLLTVQGKYQVKPPLPFVPGSEFSGRVLAVGSGVTHVKVGDAVACLGVAGGFGTHACVSARQLLPLPAGVDMVDASAFAFAYGTSYHALMDRGTLRASEWVLVLGAAGGVGSAAVQIAKAAGARVIAAVSTPDKAAWCQEVLGADATLVYGTEQAPAEHFRETLKSITEGHGPDVVYDPVGGTLAEAAFRSIAWRGRYLVVGFAGGPIPSLPLNLALLKGAAIVGVFWGDFVRREPKAFGADWQQLAQWYAAGKVNPIVAERVPLSRLKDAYTRMATRQVKGKLVVLVDGVVEGVAAGE